MFYKHDTTRRKYINFLSALVLFDDNLDPDQAQQNFKPDLYPNWLTLYNVFVIVDFEIKSVATKNNDKIPSMQKFTTPHYPYDERHAIL